MSAKQKHAFEGMEIVKKEYASAGVNDTEFAQLLSKRIGRAYSVAQVRQYRTTLGIPNNAPRGPAERLTSAEDLLSQVEDYCKEHPKKALPETLCEAIGGFLHG